MNATAHYVQLVAIHREFPERLLLRDGEGQCYLWHGDGSDMEEISGSLASWITERPEIDQMQAPLLWFDPTSLPLSVPVH